MQPWEQVQALNKSGQPQKALELGKKLLAETPGDFKVRSQAQWAVFYLLKAVAARIHSIIEANKKGSFADFMALLELLEIYKGLEPTVPDMATSNVLLQLAKIGQHFDGFLPFVRHCGLNCLREEDFDLREFKGQVSKFSLAMELAREASKWVEARPNTGSDDVAFVAELIRQVQGRAKDTDKTWLDWDMVKLLRRTDHHREAAALIVGVLKRKRTESWAWAEAGRVHRDAQPELAIACFCQALRLGNEPKYLGPVHRELAELLAGAGEYSQATAEALIAAQIYDREGWRHPRELEELFQSDWYDPALPARPAEEFYAEHADEALTLCFDHVVESDATFLGMTEPREGKKPKPRFAVLEQARSVSVLGRRGGKLLRVLSPGSPVKVVLGVEGDRRDILEVHPRPEGTRWDRAAVMEGVISRHSPESDRFTLYCGKGVEVLVPVGCWPAAADVAVGNGARIWGATNPVNGRFEVCGAEPASLPQHPDIRVFEGVLKTSRKGDGFVDGVFIPGRLLDVRPDNVSGYSGVAVRSFDKAKQRESWLAIVVRPPSSVVSVASGSE
jgi:tetratricopeptide (TPR) repeat protein